MNVTSTLKSAVGHYQRATDKLEQFLEPWFLGLMARFVFVAVLFGYYYNSFATKVGEGVVGFFQIRPSAYYQIALPAVEAAGGNVSAVSFFPWGLMVIAGTYGEFILPILIVLGLFGRLAALGMIVFILVQTLVDITVHMVDAATIGALFDRFPDSLIMDQRLLWIFPLLYLFVKGPGLLSVDALLARRFQAMPSARQVQA
ncbi:DoxX family protein [Peteryoungia desertarenae]|uniref:DoxX family protein n=1 Tax=Peteryoungia desertarenae TaxID=1813451 RepID=A0ABX6QI68_9HYPH|nr:DoxX family protein [Peteryoungia desertarenae]